MRKLSVLLSTVALLLTSATGSAAPNKSLSEMIGQMIMVGFLGDTKDHPWFGRILKQVEAGKITGVLYLRRNIRNQQALREMNAALGAASKPEHEAIIGVDQEGGLIQRLTASVGFASVPSARRVTNSMRPEEASQIYADLAKRLRAWGFNFNLGPVVDVDVNPHNPIIGRLGRSFSRDPQTVARYASAFVKGHREHGVLTVLKHFPGHGSSREDSHRTVVDVTNTWSQAELEPYRQLIDRGQADLIMSGHIHNDNLNAVSKRLPASLSGNMLTKLLRGVLRFDGVVISDDMQMRAISDNYSFGDAVKKAVLAGTDILVFANDRNPDIEIPNKVISILTQEADAVRHLATKLDAEFCDAVQLLWKCSGSVIVTGMGKAGLIGQKIAATLSSTGTRSHCLHPAEAVHGDIGCIHENDVVLALSNSGETEEVNRLLPIIRHMNVPVIAITASPSSSLGAAADITVHVGKHPEADTNGVAPSTSTTVMLAVGDALALVLSQLKGFTAADFAKFHPGGSLGRKLQTIDEAMRPAAELRIARDDATVREVLVAASKPGRRSGAVILVNEARQLTGLFTDSDLTRLLEQRRDEQLDQPINLVMTRNPITVRCENRLTDAIDLMSDRKLSELPVVDADGEPVGLIDITDLLGTVDAEQLRGAA